MQGININLSDPTQFFGFPKTEPSSFSSKVIDTKFLLINQKYKKTNIRKS